MPGALLDLYILKKEIFTKVPGALLDLYIFSFWPHEIAHEEALNPSQTKQRPHVSLHALFFSFFSVVVFVFIDLACLRAFSCSLLAL